MAHPEILKVYRVLENELWTIRIAMTLDHQLRGCDSESMGLLNRAAGRALYYTVFFTSRDLIMSIARLADKAVMSEGRKNEKHNCTFRSHSPGRDRSPGSRRGRAPTDSSANAAP
jgi:hypothetical protein